MMIGEKSVRYNRNLKAQPYGQNFVGKNVIRFFFLIITATQR